MMPYSSIKIPKWNEHLFAINKLLEEMGVLFKVDANHHGNRDVSFSMLPINNSKVYTLGEYVYIAEAEQYFAHYKKVFNGKPGLFKEPDRVIAFNGTDYFIINTMYVHFENPMLIENLPLWLTINL